MISYSKHVAIVTMQHLFTKLHKRRSNHLNGRTFICQFWTIFRNTEKLNISSSLHNIRQYKLFIEVSKQQSIIGSIYIYIANFLKYFQMRQTLMLTYDQRRQWTAYVSIAINFQKIKDTQMLKNIFNMLLAFFNINLIHFQLSL